MDTTLIKKAAGAWKILEQESIDVKGKTVCLLNLRNLKYAKTIVNLAKSIVILDDLDAVTLWSAGIETYGLKVRVIPYDFKDVDSLNQQIMSFVRKHEKNEVACVAITKTGYNYKMSDAKASTNMDYEMEDTLKDMTKKMIKFDLVIGNPPYGNKYNPGLHLKIHTMFEQCVSETGAIVFVHPSRFALSHKEGVKSYPMENFESIHLIWGNELFGIGLFVPIAITVWQNNKTTRDIKVIDDAFTYSKYTCDCDMVHIYGSSYPLFKKWVDILRKGNGSVRNHGKKIITSKYGIVLGTIRGTPPRSNNKVKVEDDFFTIVPKDEKRLDSTFRDKKWESSDYPRGYEFSSKNERTNFINYLKTKCVRFILSLSKTGKALHDGELGQIPWLDFSRPWTDKDLRKLWNVNDKMWKFIDENIPDYYPDYHEDGFYEDKKSSK